MMDFFRLLDEPRRPWLDPEALKQKFLALSALAHPDRVHAQGEAERESAQSRYTDLNAAYQCLREPRARLRHFLELERGAAPAETQSIPPDLADLFLAIGPPSREADQLLSEKAALSSPLLKVEWFQRSLESREKLGRLNLQLGERAGRLLEELRSIDVEWAAGTVNASRRVGLLGRLEELCRLLGYFDRWTAQLRDRIGRLAL
jgi:curved DNA-binding protein CbpA